MALTIVGTPGHSVTAGATSSTIPVSGLTAGDKIIACWRYRNVQSVVSATALGNAMTALGSSQAGDFLDLQWYQYTVTGGDSSSGDVVLTIDGAARHGGVVWVLNGWDAVGTPAHVTTTGTSITQDVSSQTGSLVLAAGHVDDTVTVTQGAGQTERQDETDTVVGAYFASDEPGATTVTMSHSWTGSLAAVQSAVNVTAAAGAGTTLYFLDSAASGSNFGQLQVGGSAPSTATTATGWTVDTVGSGQYALMAYASERASSVFSGTAQPAGNPDNSLGDCFRTTSTLSGDFATGVWTIAVPVIAVSAAAGQDGRVRVRLWKSANATGTSPTEITSGAVAGTAVTNLTTGAEQVSTVTTGSITGFSMTNEYLFVQIAWEIAGAAT